MFGFETEYTCPLCKGVVVLYLTCPGWGSRENIMVCADCGNADEYICQNEECGWWYREPNRRSDKDVMGVRPQWLDEAIAWRQELEDVEEAGVLGR
jgi:RecJ-like exonuclease